MCSLSDESPILPASLVTRLVLAAIKHRSTKQERRTLFHAPSFHPETGNVILLRALRGYELCRPSLLRNHFSNIDAFTASLTGLSFPGLRYPHRTGELSPRADEAADQSKENLEHRITYSSNVLTRTLPNIIIVIPLSRPTPEQRPFPHAPKCFFHLASWPIFKARDENRPSLACQMET
jgi:hypothetical protein